MKLNIVIVGVGGQGALTTSGILARAAMRAGLNVITAETHGMAQRGGSVEVHVRLGDVKAPLIPEGGADVMIALEPSEAIRYAKFLNNKSVVILNTRKIIPPSVTAGTGTYPELDEILAELRRITPRVIAVNASEIAEKAGNILATNVVVVGMLLGYFPMPFKLEHVEEVIREVMPDKIVDLNLKALKMGYEATKSTQPSAV
ncbi:MULTISPECIES: indolepyruvate ferredoxin oxidoreductase subunit beta [unclassified Archaeoglobus]|jgi:indolepyruvate ferredoxin oxidoreductase beta subunit|uniref:indolepyruvate ferredoxin oxidoreductase subunit beta n=1 Tax=unclassified Archaeoglobus TaxID=2643606 RepID=UPI0025C08D22|nr:MULTISPECIES: indolepyruvate ferredoxin oxidoreductase subunit beta [unclassified Archaeoglobus]